MPTGRNRLIAVCVAALIVAAGSTAHATPEEDYAKGLELYKQSDVIAAMGWLEKAATAGNPDAQVLLAQILDGSNDNARALDLYRKAAEQGSAAGELGLGGMYAAGEGIERDPEQALHWIRMAAEKDHGPAIVALADAYRLGSLGLEPDPARAREWLARGVEAGYEPAVRSLQSLDASEPPPPAEGENER